MKRIYLVFLLFAVCSCTRKRTSSVLLELKPERGDMQQITVTVSATQKSKEIVSSETSMKFMVDSVSDNRIVYLVYLTRLRAATNVGDKKEEYNSNVFSYDTTKKDYQHLGKTLRALYSIAFDRSGNIVSPFKPIAGDMMAPPVDADLIQMAYPTRKVAIGDSWIHRKHNTRLATTNVFTYTVEDIDREHVVIGVTAFVEGVKSLTPDATATGQYVINRKDGSLSWGFLNMPSAYAKVYMKVVAN